jgi:pheromone a factor receptor
MICVLTIRAFLHCRAQFTDFLSSNTTLTANHYFRLMVLAFSTPFLTYDLYLNVIQSSIAQGLVCRRR